MNSAIHYWLFTIDQMTNQYVNIIFRNRMEFPAFV